MSIDVKEDGSLLIPREALEGSGLKPGDEVVVKHDNTGVRVVASQHDTSSEMGRKGQPTLMDALKEKILEPDQTNAKPNVAGKGGSNIVTDKNTGLRILVPIHQTTFTAGDMQNSLMQVREELSTKHWVVKRRGE